MWVLLIKEVFPTSSKTVFTFSAPRALTGHCLRGTKPITAATWGMAVHCILQAVSDHSSTILQITRVDFYLLAGTWMSAPHSATESEPLLYKQIDQSFSPWGFRASVSDITAAECVFLLKEHSVKCAVSIPALPGVVFLLALCWAEADKTLRLSLSHIMQDRSPIERFPIALNSHVLVWVLTGVKMAEH